MIHDLSEQPISPIAARQKLEAAGALQWIHWVILSFSLGLTVFAWYYSKSALDARVTSQFDRESSQVVELVQERMRKYEDALWSGVAMTNALNGDVSVDRWSKYANSIDIEVKYPGINGIGVIHAVSEAGLPQYLEEQRRYRPNFSVHPEHKNGEHFPISYIVPVAENAKAVGLDLAHEANRFTAAKRARITGEAQVTGPITLVQDSDRTPGFLFYAPFYRGGIQDTPEQRRENFAGMVYAPFVVKKLMKGVLEKDKRHVGIRLTDGDEVLYDEHVSSEEDFDSNPLFKRSVDVPLYGRIWTFDVWSANSFRKAADDTQPFMILFGGVLIDSLLLMLFVTTTRSSKLALRYADSMTLQLERNNDRLKSEVADRRRVEKALKDSNNELEQFAYIASHDLQEPLRKISSYCELLREECGAEIPPDGHEYMDVVIDAACRLKVLVSDLLAFSKITSGGSELVPTHSADCLQAAVENMEMAIDECNAQVTFDLLPEVMGDNGQLVHVFQNLIGNAIKYRGEADPIIHVGVEEQSDQFEFHVSDNGIGIQPEFFTRVFEIFQRLHNRREYSGTGIGLAVCKRIIDRSGGSIWVESTIGQGSTFYFTLAKPNRKGDASARDTKVDANV